MNSQKVEMSQLAPIISEIVSSGGTFCLGVTGSSMYPLLSENRDSVILSKPDSIKKYDIIFYLRDNGHYVLHRIVRTSGSEFALCGDNQQVIEYPIRKNQVIAKVTAIVRKGRQFPTSSKKYRFYVFLWCHAAKIRRPVMEIYLRVGAFYNKVKKHIKA